MRSFVASVRNQGILQPLLVRKVEDGYEIVAGERRYRAAQEVGLARVPAVVRDWSDEEAHMVALAENLQRENLNPVEETEGIIKLLSVKLDRSEADIVALLYRMDNETKGKITHNVMGNPEVQAIEQVFEALSRQSWRSFVVNRLPLLKLPPDVLEVLRAGRVEYTKARLIARVSDSEQRERLLQRAIAENLSLSQLRKAIDQLATTQQLARRVYMKRLQALGKVIGNQGLTSGERARVDALLSELEAIVKR
jgi:ParB family chromosome partitioning protein